MTVSFVATETQVQSSANSDTFSMTLTPSTADGRILWVHYAAPSWGGGITECTFDSIPGFLVHDTSHNNAGAKPIRHEVWAVMNLTSSTAAKTFRASCSKATNSDARISIAAYSGASTDSGNFYSGDSSKTDVSTSISISLAAGDTTGMYVVFPAARASISISGDTAERYNAIINSGGRHSQNDAIIATAATTFIQDGPDEEARLMWGALLLPPQNVSVDLTGAPMSVATSAKVGTVDDGNISITLDAWSISSSITIGSVQEFEPIEADMFLQKY